MDARNNHKINKCSPQGSSYVLDCWGCDFGLLNSAELLLTHAIVAAKTAGMHVLTNLIVPFEPQGLSIILVLSESHLTIHTTPECGYAGVDIFCCGKGNPEIAGEYLVKVLKPNRVFSKRIQRGTIQSSAEVPSEDEKEVEIHAEK